jgi:two-component system sensor histidine kinase KdpD
MATAATSGEGVERGGLDRSKASKPEAAILARSKGMRVAFGTLAGVAALGASTVAAFQLHWNLAATSSLYLLVTVFVSVFAGFWEATAVSLLAVTCLNYYFVPPIFTFHVGDSGDWVALVAFECSALIVTRLSARARQQAEVAAAHRRNAEKLYELSRRMLLLNPRRDIGPQIVNVIREVIQPEGMALFDARAARVDEAGAGPENLGPIARAAYLTDRNESGQSGVWQRVLHMGATSLGAIVLRGEDIDSSVADAIASLAAIALERARSFEQQSSAEAARQTEQLRTTVLDALAHAFKTPLTAIRAASSGLLETAALDESALDLVTLIDHESERLNQLTTRLLQMARLESAEVRLRPEDIDVSDLIGQILRDYGEVLEHRRVSVSAGGPGLHIRGDRELLRAAIGQFVDNASKYSPAGSPISIAAVEDAAEAVISVHNEGSRIEPEHQKRIFDRYYRVPHARHRASGTGLGLSIARKAAEAHNGRVWVESGDERGTTFHIAIPRNARSVGARG